MPVSGLTHSRTVRERQVRATFLEQVNVGDHVRLLLRVEPGKPRLELVRRLDVASHPIIASKEYSFKGITGGPSGEGCLSRCVAKCGQESDHGSGAGE